MDQSVHASLCAQACPMPGGAACCELLPPAGRQELGQAPAALCRSPWAAHNASGHLPKGGCVLWGPELGD